MRYLRLEAKIFCLMPRAKRSSNRFKKEVWTKMAEKKFNKDMVIGDVLKANPGAIKVIEKYFGQGCFTCPGMKMESISFGALMHNIDPEVIVKELNALEG
jgi:hybrid cluster-associated redox disulfide protein